MKISLSVTLLFILITLNTFLLISLPLLFTQSPSDQTIRSYLLTGNKASLINILTPNEASHIYDVHTLFITQILCSLVALPILISIIKKNSLTILRSTAKTSIIILFIFTLPILLLFNTSFIYFHHLLFPQGNWSFPPDSTLIQLYPESFWYYSALALFILTILELLFLHKHLTEH